MHPILLKLGPLTIHTYGVMLALGAAMGLFVTQRLAGSAGLDREKIMNLALWVLLSAILGSRLVFVALEPEPFYQEPWRILAIWEGGLVFYGGVGVGLVVGVLLALLWKIPLLTMVDCFAPGLAIGQAFGRLGCFFAGCCYGIPCDGDFCVVFNDPYTLAPRDVPLVPSQLIQSASMFIIFGLSLLVWKKRRHPGQVFFAYGLMHGVTRIIMEQIRSDFRGQEVWGFLTPTGIFALAFALLSAGALWYLTFMAKGKGDRLEPSK